MTVMRRSVLPWWTLALPLAGTVLGCPAAASKRDTPNVGWERACFAVFVEYAPSSSATSDCYAEHLFDALLRSGYWAFRSPGELSPVARIVVEVSAHDDPASTSKTIVLRAVHVAGSECSREDAARCPSTMVAVSEHEHDNSERFQEAFARLVSSDVVRAASAAWTCDDQAKFQPPEDPNLRSRCSHDADQ